MSSCDPQVAYQSYKFEVTKNDGRRAGRFYGIVPYWDMPVDLLTSFLESTTK